MIDNLTSEQEVALDKYREEYTQIGLSTKPIDFELAIATIKKFQGSEANGYSFEFVQSPNQFPREAKIMTYGAHDVHWVAYYTYFNDFFGVCPSIVEMYDIVRNCSWVAYSEQKKIIYISNSPCTIKLDEQDRVHCENGPAIAYRDGFELYVWHGQQVPDKWIKDKRSITVNDFLYHSNIELRRIAAEIVGWDTVLQSLDHVVLDQDIDPEIGTLIEATIPQIGKERFIRVMCGTKRQFSIPVPPEATTALEAQAMLFGLTPEEFKIPEIRT